MPTRYDSPSLQRIEFILLQILDKLTDKNTKESEVIKSCLENIQEDMQELSR